MEVKDLGLAALMTLSSLVLTNSWLARFGDSNPVIVLTGMGL